VDGDGRDEVVIARQAGENAKYFVFDDAANNFAPLFQGGRSWGDENYATCCAVGDIDGDGRDEIVIGRKAGSNLRFEVRDDENANFAQLFAGGEEWGGSNYTTDVAVGANGSGNPVIGVARKAGGNARFFVFGGTAENFRLLFSGGDSWGDSNYATGIAFGDVDGDGKLEVGVTRLAGENARFFVFNDRSSGFRNMHSGGADWGDQHWGTGLAFGDVDGDGRDELVVARKAHSNARFLVYDDFKNQFRVLHNGGTSWGNSNWATAVAMGDVDNDGLDEILVSRRAGVNARYFLLDDKDELFRTLTVGGYQWKDESYATAAALGNVGGAGSGSEPHLGIGRKASQNARFFVKRFQL
jgi:hypothetical protein